MKKILTGKLTYANVAATIAVFIALGGSAYAATQLDRNSVGTKQLRKNSVTRAKIKKNAVTGAKVKDRSLTGDDLAIGTITGSNVKDGSLGGVDVDIDQSSLTSVRASNVIGVAMDENCAAAVPFPAGVSATPIENGCLVTFGSSVINCMATATVAFRTDSKALFFVDRTAHTVRKPSVPNQIYVYTYSKGEASVLPVDLVLVC
jgi:hypothetical protein